MDKKEKKIVWIFWVIFWVFLIVLLFFVFNKNKVILENTNSTWSIFSWWLINSSTEEKKLSIKLITDKRNSETDLTWFLNILKNWRISIQTAEITELDFSDKSVQEFLKKNNIKKLPAIIFSSNDYNIALDKDFDSVWNLVTDVRTYLSKIPSWEYFLEIWATYNPFSASERWLAVFEKNILENIKKDYYFQNLNDKEIIWLEFGDLSCSFCREFNNSWVIEDVLKTYDWKISKAYSHFIAHQWEQFEALECMYEQKSEKWFFELIKTWFENNYFSAEDLTEQAALLWANKEKFEECLNSGRFSEKINSQNTKAKEIFSVTWSPTSIFINSKTWEYKIVSWFLRENMKETLIEAIEKVKN